MFVPGYINLFQTGELARRALRAREIISDCTLCPHRCRVDRNSGRRGKCRSGGLPIVSSFHVHRGEESCLVGRGGSGTIFFTNCNLHCVFCQNYDISHLGRGDITKAGTPRRRGYISAPSGNIEILLLFRF